MRSSMTIKHGSENIEHFICPCTDCNADPEKAIPVFYSYEHAIEAGWVATREEKYCEPGKSMVFVCPECYAHNNRQATIA